MDRLCCYRLAHSRVDCQVELLEPAVTQQQDVVYRDSSLGCWCVSSYICQWVGASDSRASGCCECITSLLVLTAGDLQLVQWQGVVFGVQKLKQLCTQLCKLACQFSVQSQILTSEGNINHHSVESSGRGATYQCVLGCSPGVAAMGKCRTNLSA